MQRPRGRGQGHRDRGQVTGAQGQVMGAQGQGPLGSCEGASRHRDTSRPAWCKATLVSTESASERNKHGGDDRSGAAIRGKMPAAKGRRNSRELRMPGARRGHGEQEGGPDFREP